MSGTIKFGRVGVDLSLREPSTWQEQGNQVSASGWAQASSKSNALALRDQLLGLDTNPDEPAIRVTCTTDTSRSGFYRDLKVTASTAPTIFRGSFYFPWAITMTRVLGSAAPGAEMLYSGADMSGKPGGVTAFPYVAIPTSWTSVTVTGVTTSGGPLQRTGERGTVNLYGQTGSAVYSAVGSASPAPADWYDSSPTVTVDGTVVVGKQCNPSTTWTLDNGLLMISPHAASNDLDVAVSIGGGWLTSSRLKFYLGAIYQFATVWRGPTIIRNAPHQVTARFTADTAAIVSPTPNAFTVRLDLTLDRGRRICSVSLYSPTAVDLGIYSNNTQAHIDANLGGNVSTAFDANGNKHVLLSASAFSETLGSGLIYTGSTNTFYGGFGLIRSGSPFSAAPDLATNLRDQFMAAVTETLSVVAK